LEKDYKFLQKKLPNREVWFDSTTNDEMTWLITAASDTEPGEKYLFDRRSKKLEFQYRICFAAGPVVLFAPRPDGQSGWCRRKYPGHSSHVREGSASLPPGRRLVRVFKYRVPREPGVGRV
jgi:hypothetical protein